MIQSPNRVMVGILGATEMGKIENDCIIEQITVYQLQGSNWSFVRIGKGN